LSRTASTRARIIGSAGNGSGAQSRDVCTTRERAERVCTLTLGQGFAYGGIFIVATLVDVERVYHHEHYVLDVVTGSLIGTATSVLMYQYQERHAKTPHVRSLVIVPTLDGRSTVMGISSAF
jgi:hypothetical protein